MNPQDRIIMDYPFVVRWNELSSNVEFLFGVFLPKLRIGEWNRIMARKGLRENSIRCLVFAVF